MLIKAALLNSILKLELLDNAKEIGGEFMETIRRHEVFIRHNLAYRMTS